MTKIVSLPGARQFKGDSLLVTLDPYPSKSYVLVQKQINKTRLKTSILELISVGESSRKQTKTTKRKRLDRYYQNIALSFKIKIEIRN